MSMSDMEWRRVAEEERRAQFAGDLYCIDCLVWVGDVDHFRDGYCDGCWTCPHDHEEDEPCEDFDGNPVVTEGVMA